MTCPSPPGVVQLIVQYGLSQPFLWMAPIGGWLGVLVVVAFLLRSEVRRLPPSSGQCMMLWLWGIGLVLLVSGLFLPFSVILWLSAGDRWTYSLSNACYEQGKQMLQDQGPVLALVLAITMLLLLSVGWGLIASAQRSKRQMG